MIPSNSAIDRRNRGTGNSEHSSDLSVTKDFISEEASNKANIEPVEFGLRMLLAAQSRAFVSKYPKAMKVVVAVGDIFEIVKGIVGLIAVFMVNFLAFGHGAKKCDGNHSMNQRACGDAIPTQRYLPVSGGMVSVAQNTPSLKDSTVGIWANSPNITSATGFINTFVSRNASPFHMGTL